MRRPGEQHRRSPGPKASNSSWRGDHVPNAPMVDGTACGPAARPPRCRSLSCNRPCCAATRASLARKATSPRIGQTGPGETPLCGRDGRSLDSSNPRRFTGTGRATARTAPRAGASTSIPLRAREAAHQAAASDAHRRTPNGSIARSLLPKNGHLQAFVRAIGRP